MNSKDCVKAVLNFEPAPYVPYGEYAIDSDTVERIIGHETYLRAKARTQTALWEGRRDEVVQSLKEDMVTLYKKLDCIDIVNLMSEACGLVPPKDHIPEKPKKIADGTWEDKKGRIYKYSSITRDITMIHDPDRWDREYTPEEFHFDENSMNPPDPSCFEVIDHVVDQFKEDKFIISYAGREAGLVLLGGMERGLTEYLTDPDVVQAAIDYETRLGNYEDAFFIRDDIDAIFWGQDFAYNTGPLINPDIFYEMVLPSLKARVENVKKHNVYVFKHCCGNTTALSSLFVQAGYDCYQSIQKQAGMDLRNLREIYGTEMCLWGGVDVSTLINGTMQDVRTETKESLEIARQGGMILGSSHSIATGCNYDNFMAMLEVISNDRKQTR